MTTTAAKFVSRRHVCTPWAALFSAAVVLASAQASSLSPNGVDQPQFDRPQFDRPQFDRPDRRRADLEVDRGVPEDGHLTDRLIVRIAPAVVIEITDRGAIVRDGDGRRRVDVEETLRGVGARGIVAALATEPRRAEIAAAVGLDRFRHLLLAPDADPVDAMRRLAVHDGIFDVVELDALGGVAASGPVTPNDPDFGLQWALFNSGQVMGGVAGTPGADISATQAWVYTTGSDLVVAVLDSGVNEHVELNGRLEQGYNAASPGSPTTDVCSSHGTHVSGILAASGDNSLGIAGMSWAARIVPVVVINGCTGPESLVADGLVWATDEGVRLVNMSLQYSGGTALLQSAVQYAAALNVIMVAATGNSNGQVAFPARWPETIAVAASTNLDQRWNLSNFGPQVDLAAPGAAIWSLLGTQTYGLKNGTSMATPHVTGTIALMLSLNPNLTPAQVRQLLNSTADDIGAPGFDNFTGHGRLNAAAALAATLETIGSPADLNGDGIVDGADLGILLSAWGACATAPCPADLNDDGIVDGADLGILLAAWGSGDAS